MLTAVTGINWGDEGKGRVIDLLAEHADIVVRYQGGNNAGHTVVNKQGKFVLNLLPSGILHPDVVCVLGDGMVIDLNHLSNEIAQIRTQDVSVSPKNLKLSTRATISMPWHKIQDELEEERLSKSGAAFGSTKRGIAYAYSDKYRKKTIRLGDLLHLDEENVQARLKTMLEAKNLELAGCYHQEPMSLSALLSWCRQKAAKYAWTVALFYLHRRHGWLTPASVYSQSALRCFLLISGHSSNKKSEASELASDFLFSSLSTITSCPFRRRLLLALLECPL